MKNLFLITLFSAAIIFAQEEKEVIIKKIGKNGKVETQTFSNGKMETQTFSGDELLAKTKNIHVTANVGEGIVKKLKLSDEQKTKVEKIFFESKKSEIELGAKIALLKLELAVLMSEENIDKSSVKGKTKELSDKATNLATNKLDDWFKVNELLNADQKKTWREVLKNRTRMASQKFNMHKPPMQKFQFRTGDDDSFNWEGEVNVEVEADGIGSLEGFAVEDDNILVIPKITKGYKIIEKED